MSPLVEKYNEIDNTQMLRGGDSQNKPYQYQKNNSNQDLHQTSEKDLNCFDPDSEKY